MATKYWVGGSGNWTDTAHWSTSSGGVGGAAIPAFVQDGTSFEFYGTEDVVFDANSFSTTGLTVTVGGNAFANNLTTATVTNSPTFSWGSSSSRLRVFGDLNITGTQWPTGGGSNRIELNGFGSHSITTGGSTTKQIRFFNWGGTATYTISGDVVMGTNGIVDFSIENPLTLNLGSHSITTTTFLFPGAFPLTLSTGTINVLSTLSVSATDLTCYDVTWNVTANVYGPADTTGVFAGSSTAHPLTLTNNSGSSKTISGVTLRNTILNGTSGFVLERVVDDGGNDWGGGGGGPGNPPKKYYVKLPPDYIALP